MASNGNCPQCGFLAGGSDPAAPWIDENWGVLIRLDRDYFERLDPDGVDFPETTHSRRVNLVGDLITIGRRSKTREIRPDIDLATGTEDTATSHRHAVLMRQPEGNWAVVDQTSTNGTYLNDDDDPVPPNQPVPLADGDRIHVGYWTTLTMERLDSSEQHVDVDSRPSKSTRNVARARRMVEVDLLGPLEVRVHGAAVPMGAPRDRAVLSLLALRIGTPVSVLDLELALWSDEPPNTADKALQGYVVNLRKVLPEKSIDTQAPGYRLNGPKDAVDTHRFERRCSRGRALLLSGHPGAAAAELERALRLWRGEPLVDLTSSPIGVAESMSLKERRAAAQEDLFEARLQLGHHYDLMADLAAAVEAEPMRQRRWAQQMLALYRSNRQQEATLAFQRLSTLLVESGLNPSPELEALDRAILFNDPALQWAAPREPGAGAAPVAISP